MNNVFAVMPITTEMHHILSGGNGRDETTLNMKQLCAFPRVITGYPGFRVLAYCYRMLYCFADLVLRIQETHCTTLSTCFRDYFESLSLNMSEKFWALSMVQGHAEFSCGDEVKCVIFALAALNEIAKIMFTNRLPHCEKSNSQKVRLMIIF